MFELRPYQQQAVDAVVRELKSGIDPFIIEAAGGAGKSVIVAEVARIIHQMSGKRILCTAPTAELVKQNRSKYAATGNPCSMFSASAGQKSLRHPVIFGTPGTIKNRISAFKRDFAMIVIDECDLITPTMRSIIDEMRKGNPNLRVFGLTATTYRTGTGYIFREWPDGRVNGEDVARDPYYARCVFRIEANTLIQQGYLTPPLAGAINADAYDTDNLLPNRQGRFDSAEVDRAYHGHGRKTSLICQDIVAQSRNRRGVLLYAATVQHAQEVMASLPPGLSAIITGETKDREGILKSFSQQKIKYVVNVGVLTVGVDMPHVDVIAILRKMESIRLFQQILYRGTRLFPDKNNFLVLDYGGNMDAHTPDGDLFKPIVRAKKAPGEGIPIDVECPGCGYTNEFGLQPDYAEYPRDIHGHALDVFGQQLMGDFGPVPVHYGRRCMGVVSAGKSEWVRCGHRWSGKPCPACDEPNDIAARYCYACKAEIVDPAQHLISVFKAMKRDPTQPQTERIVSLSTVESTSQRGNRTLRVDFVTEYRQFSIWLMPEPTNNMAASQWAKWQDTDGNPKTVSYVKEADSQFFRVLAYNKPADDEELPSQVMEATEKMRKYA